MSTFISIPVTGSDNYIINSHRIITCVRTSATTTIIVVEGGTGSSTSTDRIEITHATDTAAASVAYSIMASVVMSSSTPPGGVRTVVPAQAISSINFSGAAGSVVTSVTASLPLSSSGGSTPNITISKAATAANGYLSSTDWNTFNSKGDGVVTTLTTTGSGAASLVGNTLNIPTSTGDMLESVYDPTGVAADVYDYANALGITQITGSIITAPTLTGNVDNWNPTGFATSNMIRVDVNANNRQITGMIAPSAGVNRIVRINNLNTGSNDIKYMENDNGSVAANRFLLRDNADKSSKPNETAAFWYDHTSSRWRPLNRVG